MSNIARNWKIKSKNKKKKKKNEELRKILWVETLRGLIGVEKNDGDILEA